MVVQSNIDYGEFPLCKVQGSHAPWKVREFKKGISQAPKVMENDCGHGKVMELHQ